ncbi:MAG: GH116 family glycosyl hydrolase, partial [bacterium]
MAACEAAEAMANAKGNSALATTYQGWLTTGQASFESLLWDNIGGYYHIDTGSTIPSRIMSDQLAGEWYAKALGLPGIVSDAHANSAWQKIHDNNWQKFDTGTHGVVNVMAAAGTIINDPTNPQGQEAWVGVGWSVAAGLIEQGLTTQGLDIGNSLYNSIWNLGQYWFRTPEAWQTGLTNMRAPYYMRANAIWSVKNAYDVASASSCGAFTCTPTFTPTKTSTATITATPTITATVTPMPTLSACAAAVFRVNAGGGAYTGSVAWSADQAYTTGNWGYVSGTAAASITNGITAPSDPAIYQTERYGSPLEYKFTVPNGTYQVVLHFVEQHWTGTGERVFNVAINGSTV